MKKEYSDYYTEIGLKIAYYRKLRGLTQEQLAEKVNKSWSFIAQIESTKINKGISFDTFFDISLALDISPYKFLLFDSEDLNI